MKTIKQIERNDCSFISHKHIMYYVTGGCMFKCPYCDTINNNSLNTDIDNQKVIVDTLFKLNEPFEIYLYGGEPTEYIYIHELISYILTKQSKYFLGIELQTNLNVSQSELEKFCSYENFVISPSIHLTFLKNDDTHTLLNKMIYINTTGKLNRIDFMLERWKYDDHIMMIDLLKEHKLHEKVIYAKNFYEFNGDDSYTGRFNNYKYDSVLSGTTNQESYYLTYEDGQRELRTLNDLVPEHISFKGWYCDARRFLIWLHYSGDWWECNVAYKKRKPKGNLLENENHFL